VQYRLLKTVPGIGEVLAITIMLETGTISRFTRIAISPPRKRDFDFVALSVPWSLPGVHSLSIWAIHSLSARLLRYRDGFAEKGEGV
jgi:hypothetical protein